MKSIAIITDWSPSLGSGHIQRMAALADFLNRNHICHARIITSRPLPFTGTSFFPWTAEKIPRSTDLIIRDMRDSRTEDIRSLGKSAPVLVIDDNGPGRGLARAAVDLLPNPAIPGHNASYHPQAFIFGYSFYRSIEGLKEKIIRKDIDLAIYPGSDASPAVMDYFAGIVPENRTAVIMAGDRHHTTAGGRITGTISRSYGEIILSSRAVLSHFGITLYEGHIASARLLALNPSPYHAQLADLASDLGIVNLGIRETVDQAALKEIIATTARDFTVESVAAREVLDKINAGLENFTRLMLQII